MADHYKRLRSVRKSDLEQMTLYCYLRQYKKLTEKEQGEIRALVADIAADEREGKALFRLLTTGESFRRVVERSYVPEGKLNRMRAEFYRRWTW